MPNLDDLLSDHLDPTRRYFLRLAAAGAAGATLSPWLARADDAAGKAALAKAIAGLEYFTQYDKFGTVERGNPLPYTHPIEKLREVGLTRETWRLEVVPDPDSNAQVENPLSKERRTALDWDGLMRLAETKSVRFSKIITCNNIGAPLGMGLWEGVPLREVVWMAKPVGNVRRVFYYGYHNDDPKQMFRSSLPIGRVLEDPPGEYPVILCYKLNGELLTGKRGGPVRILVPETYGFKSVKWLQKVVLTNGPAANDTYADGNNDVDSWMKTFAQFILHPAKATAGEPIPLTGFAQVGISGLTKVQYWLHPKGTELPADDPHFTKAPWKDADILPAPTRWSSLPNDNLLTGARGFDPQTNRPTTWPIRYALAHWAALLQGVAAGEYELRCRSIDANGIAQPMPRPFPKSGRNAIQSVPLSVVPA
jgi:DMSO/TMAO reductase YedYZ molybdopterin-dependent catalytic subunit